MAKYNKNRSITSGLSKYNKKKEEANNASKTAEPSEGK